MRLDPSRGLKSSDQSKPIVRGLLRHLLFALFYISIGVAIGIVGLYAYQISQSPAIEPWHTAPLDADFRSEGPNGIRDFDAYLKMEDRLFDQLQEQVVKRVPTTAAYRLNRYSTGSLVNPDTQTINWNRSFEMFARPTVGGILMLHGLSDSPYSMRNLGRFLSSRGFRILGLRLPGHGTAPSGLVHATWKDFAVATRIAAKYLKEQLEVGQPLYILGYSNGAALAVEYSLSVLEGEALPPADGLILLSPAIGVPRVAALAKWQGRLAEVPGLEKFGWAPILPEFDPYKYNSFAVSAGQQIYELTSDLIERVHLSSVRDNWNQFPRVVAFQSAADATIPPDSIVENFMRHLQSADHELILFDVNRFAEASPLLNPGAGALSQQYLNDPNLPFDLTVVTNRDPQTREIVALRKSARRNSAQSSPLGMRWPPGMFSLSHIALPFPPTDPLYGELRSENPDEISLGSVELRGERGVLVIPANYFLRLRYNPFFEYLQERIIAALVPRRDQPNSFSTETDIPPESSRIHSAPDF